MINGKCLAAQIRALYDNSELLSVEVPEWADFLEDGKIYFKPLTVKEQAILQPWAQKNDNHLWVEIVLRKSLDASGNHLFQLGKQQREDLSESASYILDRISSAMLLVPEVSDFKKK